MSGDLPGVAIVGQAQTPYRCAVPDTHYGEMIYRTVMEALDDAGLGIAEIETVISSGCDTLDGRSISNVFVAEAMGAFMKEESKVEEDGAYAAMYAAMRLMTGSFDTALVVAYSKSSESSPQTYTGMIGDPFYQRPFGLEGITSCALQARRYASKHGVTEAQAAQVAVKARRAALKNPYAQVKGEHTVEDVLGSEPIASPLRRLDLCPPSDGCCALVLASEKRARELGGTPVRILGLGQVNDAYYPGHRDLAELLSCRLAAQRAYRMAGVVDPASELDVAEVTEVTSYGELMLTEALGLCGDGDGGRLAESGFTAPDGALPVNPSGGTLSANVLMAAGLARLAEAYLQLAGRAGDRQVEGAKKALVHATSGLCFQSNLVYVLGS